MTDERKQLLVDTLEEYYDLALNFISKLDTWDKSENLKGRRLDVAKILMELDNKLVESKETTEKEEVEETEKKTTKKK